MCNTSANQLRPMRRLHIRRTHHLPGRLAMHRVNNPILTMPRRKHRMYQRRIQTVRRPRLDQFHLLSVRIHVRGPVERIPPVSVGCSCVLRDQSIYHDRSHLKHCCNNTLRLDPDQLRALLQRNVPVSNRLVVPGDSDVTDDILAMRAEKFHLYQRSIRFVFMHPFPSPKKKI